MKEQIDIFCKNNGRHITIQPGSTLREVYEVSGLDFPHGPTSARVNNVVEGLTFRVYHPMDVEFQDTSSGSGLRTYARSLCFVLCKAVADLYPEGQIVLQHPVSRGHYCTLKIGHEPTEIEVERIKERMREIVADAIPFRRHEVQTDIAVRLFRQLGMNDKATLLETAGMPYSYYYTLADTVDYYYGSLLPDTGYLYLFDLVKYGKGILLRYPDLHHPDTLPEMIPQQKMLDVFKTHSWWHDIMGVRTISDLNAANLSGQATDLIHVAEALQEKEIARIADEIHKRGTVKIVLISGPSSSGKTTFSKRLSVQLMTCGMKPRAISLDDYFVNREQTPLDEQGEYDFESLYALDLEKFNNDLTALINGEEIELPYYNFETGQREYRGNRIKLGPNSVLLIEGIHGLNPELTAAIDAKMKYSIYVSALTTLSIDDHNWVPTTDNRLLRRIVRDHKYRGVSAVDTIKRWPSVRRGEEKWIFPYQENADAMFNSSLLFELGVIKEYGEEILKTVPRNTPEYGEAYRLRAFLSYFTPIGDQLTPSTSLLREFLGGSSFKY